MILSRPADPDHPSSGEDGFTLVELLVVLAILALLVGIATPKTLSYLDQAKLKSAQVAIANLSETLELYKLDTGHYPSNEEGLGALVSRPKAATVWNGPYVTRSSALDDPWGRPYHYRQPGEHGPFDLHSLGPNGTANPESNNGVDPVLRNW